MSAGTRNEKNPHYLSLTLSTPSCAQLAILGAQKQLANAFPFRYARNCEALNLYNIQFVSLYLFIIYLWIEHLTFHPSKIPRGQIMPIVPYLLILRVSQAI